MPELPEVQTIVDDLNRQVRGRRIVGIALDWPKMIQYPAINKRQFAVLTCGRKILRVERRGKYIKFYLSGNILMIIHPKMTGRFLLENGEKPETNYRHSHLKFYLDNSKILAFSDVRKLGKVWIGKIAEVENLANFKNLGPEPLNKSLNLSKFIKLIQFKKRKIKQLLMDQTVIAGIGNIYSDEALWLSKIYPLTLSQDLTKIQLKTLLRAIKSVLKKSLKLRGSSMRDYRDIVGNQGNYYEQRLVYHREGEPCLRCGTKIRRIKIGGRSAHYCPQCQYH